MKSLAGKSERDIYISVDGNLLCMSCDTGDDKANRIPQEIGKYRRNIAYEANLYFIDLFAAR